MDQFRQDLRTALRNVRKYPVACVVAVLSLAGGLGAMTATLTVRNVLFRNPPPLYPDPGHLSRIQVGTPQQPVRPLGSPVPAALFRIWHEGQIGGATGASTAARTRDVRAGDQTVQRPVRSVTPEFFSVIGVPPIVGRVTPDTDSGNAPAVLSYRVWQVLFEGRADVVGQALWIDNQPYSVVAVMPDRFWFSSMDSPIWTPLALSALHANELLDTIVRRDAGVSPAALAARLQPGLDEYARALPEGDRLLNLRVSGIEGTPVAMSMAFVLPYLIAVCVALTLLIACANVAILMIAQWTGREQEIAIRSSLGASRGRIVRALLTESLLIATVGGTLGIAVTYALRGVIVRRAGPLVAFFDLTIPWSVLLQGILLTLMAGVIYLPVPVVASSDLQRVIFLVRAARDPGPLVEVVRRTIPKAVTGHTVVNANTIDQITLVGSQEMLVGFAPLVPLIMIGMLLTAAGVYGVLAFAITRRSKEFAVRVAVGASAADLARLVAAQSSRLVGIGLVLGLGLMWVLRQLVRSAGGAGRFFDPQWTAFAVPMLIVAVIGIVATWLPSRRARRMDPAHLLRSP